MPTWFGSVNGFGSIVLDGFFADPSSNAYYWSQNYNGLFPITIDPTTGIAIYTGTGFQPVSILTGTIFTNLSATDDEISTVAATILQGRQSTYQANPTNNLNAQTQDPSTFVQAAITNGLSGTTITNPLAGGNGTATTIPSNSNAIATSIQQNASSLISPALNFGLDDALSSWPCGSDMMTSLNKVLTNHQSEITAIQGATTKIADFKKKLVKQQVALSDEIAKIQGTTATFQASGTFNQLSKAFPSAFAPVQSVINNSNTNLNQKLSSLLPSAGLDLNSTINNIMNSVVNQFLGSIKPAIMNPMDKIIADIQKLESTANSALAAFPSTGFSSFSGQQAFVNQLTNLVNNKIQSIPIVSQLAISNPITNPATIQAALNTALQQTLQQNVTAATGLNQNAINSLLGNMSITGPTIQTTPASSQSVTPFSGNKTGTAPAQNPAASTFPTTPSTFTLAQMDPFKGGSFGNLSIIQSVTQGEVDQSITPPIVTLSPDPSIAANQNATTTAQAAANAPGITRTPIRGTGINILDEIPLRPRNTTTDSSIGDYQCVPGLTVNGVTS